jgi:hypothetical protein
MLFGMVVLTKAHRAPIVRLLPNASASTIPHMGNLYRAPIAAPHATLMRTHEVAMRL